MNRFLAAAIILSAISLAQARNEEGGGPSVKRSAAPPPPPPAEIVLPRTPTVDEAVKKLVAASKPVFAAAARLKLVAVDAQGEPTRDKSGSVVIQPAQGPWGPKDLKDLQLLIKKEGSVYHAGSGKLDFEPGTASKAVFDAYYAIGDVLKSVPGINPDIPGTGSAWNDGDAYTKLWQRLEQYDKNLGNPVAWKTFWNVMTVTFEANNRLIDKVSIQKLADQANQAEIAHKQEMEAAAARVAEKAKNPFATKPVDTATAKPSDTTPPKPSETAAPPVGGPNLTGPQPAPPAEGLVTTAPPAPGAAGTDAAAAPAAEATAPEKKASLWDKAKSAAGHVLDPFGIVSPNNALSGKGCKRPGTLAEVNEKEKEEAFAEASEATERRAAYEKQRAAAVAAVETERKAALARLAPEDDRDEVNTAFDEKAKAAAAAVDSDIAKRGLTPEAIEKKRAAGVASADEKLRHATDVYIINSFKDVIANYSKPLNNRMESDWRRKLKADTGYRGPNEAAFDAREAPRIQAYFKTWYLNEKTLSEPRVTKCRDILMSGGKYTKPDVTNITAKCVHPELVAFINAEHEKTLTARKNSKNAPKSPPPAEGQAKP
jgi:hypothetical protein